MIRGVLFSILVLLCVEADACSRCGIFGRGCRFSSHVAAVQVAAVPPAPQVLNIQNVYSSPNGAAAQPLLAPQGNTVYSLQAAAQPYTLDPSAVLRQAAELTKGAQALANQGLNGYTQTASLALTLQASQPAIQAAALAAPQQLRTQSAVQSIRLTNVNGQWQVDAATSSEQPQAQSAPQVEAAPSAVGALVHKHCAACHGLESPAPKGGYYFDQGHQLDCKPSLAAVKAVMSGKMPKGTQLSDADRSALIQELLSLSKSE